MSRVGRGKRREGAVSASPQYCGSSKHKSRPAEGAKGTLCPEWTHKTAAGPLGTDMFAHAWASTRAGVLFSAAEVDPTSKKRFATEQGIAFEAKPTNDGSWHGYPVPWESVPPDIKDSWIDKGLVTKRQTKMFFRFEKNDIHWALRTDDR